MRLRTGPFISTPILCLYAPIRKGGGGQQVAASTSLAIAFFFIVISRVFTVYPCARMDEQTSMILLSGKQLRRSEFSLFLRYSYRGKKLICWQNRVVKIGTKIEKLIRNFTNNMNLRITIRTIACIIKAVQFNYNRITHLLHHLFKIFTFRIE